MLDAHKAVWRKSTRSNPSANCVEVATNLVAATGVVGLRDSKDPHGPVFSLAPEAFGAFIGGIKTGAIDR